MLDHTLFHWPPGSRGDVEVGPEEPGQRNVPASLKVDDARRFVGREEVQRQANAKHPAQPDGRVRISGEVEVELERVGERADPGIRSGDCGPRVRCLEEGAGGMVEAAVECQRSRNEGLGL